MAVVTGDISRWGLGPFPADARLLVRFVPSSSAVGAGLVLPLREETIEPAADGTFSKSLVSTTELLPECWYSVRFEWFQKHPIKGDWNLDGWSDLPGKLRVPPEGGDITLLFETDDRGFAVPLYFGYGEPPEWLPSGGVYYDLDDPEGVGVYSEGKVV
ncbi:hypothetical protein RU09_06050 [Microbacterium sp. MEJ108Y]|uniref:hypothetical protein n=1 Tax=Microbacterium sp. MEJ108Y TaxID=1587523 RepID=UPI0005AC0123|nr:hypothetical protein [Microbacterium sp. MEJ108Y]KIP93373.1 hypothetical protein RU09_06050 [Microbacterium sp. MEJ108Y]